MGKQYIKVSYNSNGQKQCNNCKIFKNFSEFHKRASSPDGIVTYCKKCVREIDLMRNQDKLVMPKKINLKGEIHCRNCGEYFKKEQMHKGMSYCIDCSPLLSRTRTLKKYGLSLDEYHQLLEQQNFTCKVCKQKDTSFRKRLSVDHDHSCCPGEGSCGKCIRGLLCHHCNMALGAVKDNIKTLQTMIEYLNGNFR